MKQKSICTWLITIFVTLLFYQVYIMLGSAIPSISKITGSEIETVRTAYRYVNLLIYCVPLFGWLMTGVCLYRIKNRQQQITGMLLMAYAIICLTWQIVAIINISTPAVAIPRPAYITLSLLTTILLCASLIMVGNNKENKSFRRLAIAYTVTEIIASSMHIAAQFQNDDNYTLLAWYSVFSAIGLIILFVYLYKWIKSCKNEQS